MPATLTERPADRFAMLDALPIRGKRCVEIGVYQGDFAAEILARKPKDLLLVDPYRHNPGYADTLNHSQEDFDRIRETARLRFAEDKRVRWFWGTSAQAIRMQKPVFDFVNIDARHEYEHVLSDLCLWFPFVRLGGWIACHDFGGRNNCFPGVREAVEDFCRLSGSAVAFETAEEFWTTAAIQVGCNS